MLFLGRSKKAPPYHRYDRASKLFLIYQIRTPLELLTSLVIVGLCALDRALTTGPLAPVLAVFALDVGLFGRVDRPLLHVGVLLKY